MPSEPADVAVIFGNALDEAGAPKPVLAARLDVGVRCYRTGSARRSSSAARSTARAERGDRDARLSRGARRAGRPDRGRRRRQHATAQHTLAYLQAHRVSRVVIVSQYYHLARARLAFERVGIARADISAAYPRRFQLRDVYSSWREVPAYAVYAARLWVNPDARPVSFRPMLYLMSLFS